MKIISNLFLAALLCMSLPLCVTATPADNATAATQTVAGTHVFGRVTVDGQPRQGVVVTDGVNVVASDANGEYNFVSADRKYVYISVPADCKVPSKNSIPQFYKKVNGKKSKQTINFDLKSQPVANEFKLFTIADIQLGNDLDVKSWTSEILQDQVNFIKSLDGNVYGISLGDIVWNNPEMYSTYKRYVKQFGIPTFSVIGNHDHNEKTKGDVESMNEFTDAMGPNYYSCNIGKWHLIVLDDVLYSGMKGRNDYIGRITDEQMEWLKKDLSYVSKDKSILLGLHIPTARRYTPNPMRVTNSDTLHQMLSPYHFVQILSGHTHFNSSINIDDHMNETTFGAVMGAYWNGDINDDGSPRGFAVLEFKDNEVVNKYYKGSATPLEYQMKIYLPDEASLRFGKDKKQRPMDIDNENLLVNIFFWHTDWKVEVKEDNGDWQVIDNSQFKKILDPAAVKFLQGKNKWERRPKAEPCKFNDHMFLYKPLNHNWKHFAVRATDTFGNVYTDSVDKTAESR
jgi:predicted MPP superfamily phosphohydrolase